MVEQSIDLGQFASRLRSARSLVRMNRKEFCEKYGFNLHTVQSWESGRYWVRANNLERFCEALAKEGVICTPEWIVDGKGDGPKLVGTGKAVTASKGPEQLAEATLDLEDRMIQSEVESFRAAHKEANIDVVVTRVADNAMRPQYRLGDYVGGRVHKSTNLKPLLGKDCIIEIGPNNFVVRRLMSDGQRLILVPSSATEHAMSFETVLSAAEIVWHRKTEKTIN